MIKIIFKEEFEERIITSDANVTKSLQKIKNMKVKRSFKF